MNSKWIIGALVVALGFTSYQWWCAEELAAYFIQREKERSAEVSGMQEKMFAALREAKMFETAYERLRVQHEAETASTGKITEICTDGGRCATAYSY